MPTPPAMQRTAEHCASCEMTRPEWSYGPSMRTRRRVGDPDMRAARRLVMPSRRRVKNVVVARVVLSEGELTAAATLVVPTDFSGSSALLSLAGVRSSPPRL